MNNIKRIILLFILLFIAIAFPVCAADLNYGCSVRVGIIDSGINVSQVPVTDGYNFLENNNDVTDNKGHGTKIAEIVFGLVPKAEIIALKCTEKDINTDNSAIIQAIYKAVDEFKCDILNISIGMPDSEELAKAVDYATQKGVIIVSAVGNDGEISYKKEKVYYPAGYESVVGVGAVDDNDLVCEYSQKNNSVFITTESLEGTSFAAAKITGAAAIAKSFDRRISPQLFMKFLKDSASDKGNEGFDTSYGYGVLDFQNFQKVLIDRYSVLVTDETEGIVTICNLSDKEISAKLISTGDRVENREIFLKPEEKNQIYVEHISRCFIWQKSVYDIVWIKGGK